MARPKEAYLRFRTTSVRKKFLRDLVKEMNTGRNSNERITLSDLLDSMVQYFMMAYTLGKWKQPLPELRKEFVSFLNDFSKSQNDKSPNKKKPR